MQRTKLVAGNWKMNLLQSTGSALVEAFLQKVELRQDVDVVVCPPFTLLGRLRDELRRSHVHLGAQDVFWAEDGAFTGNISARMLADLGVSHCIVGHSETRGRFGKLDTSETTLPYFGETNETISLKIQALFYQSIEPILCVGETLAERKAGQTESVIAAQLEGALSGFDAAELFFFIVAYEPVWAIGTGETCPADEAERVCSFIREWFKNKFNDPDLPEQIRILYGGSVKAANAKELFNKPNIDGGLVGGASLDATEFATIVASA
ncbi:MAG: triose-phosphate isomerase [Fimbriimonadaceae bacterium]|nr:triose-phosphate isomerase [Fimbriimonadaceae bacterium]